MTAAGFSPADRVARMRESPSTVAAQRVRELKAQGADIVDWTVGEPDFDTPQTVKEAAIAAILAGQTKYTPVNGTPELRDAIRRRMKRCSGVSYTDAEITVGGGCKQLIHLAFAASLNPDDEVIVPAPYWVSYPDMVLANDGRPVSVPSTPTEEFKLTPEALRAAITSRSRWLVLNTPNNPTGAVYTRDEIAALADVLSEHRQVGVIADEIYDEVIYTDDRFVGVAEAAPQLAGRVFTVNGVSKSYAMTGWRLGYGVGDAGLVAAINKLQSQSSSCPSSISQAAAVAALDGDQSFVRESRTAYHRRRDRAIELLTAIDGLDPFIPDGAFYLFVGCAGMIGKRRRTGELLGSDQDVTLFLLEDAGVAVIQGSAYGTDPYVRVSFATSIDEIERGAARIADAVRELT